MSTRKEQITLKAIEIVKNNPDGVRYSDLILRLQKELPDIPVNTIHGTVWNLDVLNPKAIYKPVRGLYRHIAFRDTIPSLELKKIEEQDFYKPFADFLVQELEECSKAISLGGKEFQDKWGTPDVIGLREPSRSDIIKPPIEVISAEIKTNTKDLITAFGQACCYKLFSHKSYLIIPKDSSQEDISRIDSLCQIFGIGLVLFDSNDKNNPNFDIRVRPIKYEPDMFYANKYLKMIENKF